MLEAPGQNRGGRFGWKNQHASLLSFAADAYKNEMGITSPLDPVENTFNGVVLGPEFDPLPEPEDDGEDVGAVRAIHARDEGAAGGRRARRVGERAGREHFVQLRSAAPPVTCGTSPPRRRGR